MLNKGDYVLRKTGGVWGVIDTPYNKYTLKEIAKKTTETIAEDSDDIIRKVKKQDDLTDVIERIPFISTLQASNDKIRIELYEEAMAAYDEIEWIKIIKTIYLRKQEKRLLKNELNYYIEAKRYFHGEIAAMMGIKYDEVEKYIKAYIANIW